MPEAHGVPQFHVPAAPSGVGLRAPTSTSPSPSLLLPASLLRHAASSNPFLCPSLPLRHRSTFLRPPCSKPSAAPPSPPFSAAPPPPVSSFRECHLALLGDSLAAIFSLCEENHTTIEVWVMKKDFNRLVKAGESFSYRWSQEPPPPLYTCISVGFWNKNELLIWTDVQPFDFRCRGRGTPLLYDMVTKQARDLQISD